MTRTQTFRYVESQEEIDSLLALFKALAHPERRPIVEEAAWRPISPSGITRGHRLSLSRASKHVKHLSECGALKLVDREEVRGAVKHLYRATPRAVLACAVLDVAQDDLADETPPEIKRVPEDLLGRDVGQRIEVVLRVSLKLNSADSYPRDFA